MYKFLLTLGYLLPISISILGQHTEYYSTIRFVETPLSSIEGSIPLTQSEALKRHHYQFKYTDRNRLSSIEFYNGNVNKTPNNTASLFTLSHRMEFSISGNTEIISFFGTDENPTLVLGQVAFFEYELNEHGQRKALYFKDPEGNRIENSWGIFRYTWEYDRNGYVIEDRFNKQNERVSIRPGFKFYLLKLFFGPKGSIRLMQNIDHAGNLVENESGAAQDLITVNAEGNFIKWEVLDKDGNLEKGNGPNVAIGLQTFDSYGYETSLEHFDEYGNTIFNSYGFAKSQTTYDSYGNLAERKFIGLEGTPAPHQIAGYTHLKIDYDPSGNYRTRLAYYDEQMNLILHKTRGYAIVKYSYDNQRQLIQIKYLNTQNELVNRLDNGVAYIEYSYDSKQMLTDVLSYDKHKRLVQ